MKIIYAFRRSTVFPHIAGDSWPLPPEPTLSSFLTTAKSIGFEGLELGFEDFGGGAATEYGAKELQAKLESFGLPCVAIRAGGSLCMPISQRQSRERLHGRVDIAGWLGLGIVNTALSGPPRNKTLGPNDPGKQIQEGSSQLATVNDFEQTSAILREAGDKAGNVGANITVEVHQNSIADNSRSTSMLLDMVDSDNVFANPDLGNLLWHYDEPEESCEDAIMALAARSKYWHCKNLQRVHIPELGRTYFLKVPIPDGDIDYRFAISAMLDADYDGYFAMEGTRTGDHLSKDGSSVRYVRGLMKELSA